ncbi:MAG: protein kinase [Planctomycetes bacterium]|nr:protein kinase [Planctomycetota bacterium]
MDTSWRRIRELFEHADALPPRARSAFLDSACGDDAALHRELSELLAAADESAGALEPPPTPIAPCPALHAAPGTLVGGYRLGHVLAAGGMGIVYEAEQQNPRRRVALKMMTLGFDSPGAARRFRHEAEILGRLRHPHIAQVFEAGVHVDASGYERPWFAMELVEGATDIVGYATQCALAADERLRLFTDVCDAVHHGHQRGVVHRDLKPDNLLVDGEGRVKVIDFGVARTTHADVARRTIAERSGDIVGTLRYMSPEQLEGRSDTIDTRTDVHALGVVLYELLTGELPYDLDGKPLFEVARIVRDDAPRRPSTCGRPVVGDLELIVLTAIAKEPERRYASAAALADDVRRYLRREPVAARPPSMVYQLRMLGRRHRLLVGAVIAIAATLVAAAILSAGAAVRARRAEAEVRTQLDAVERAERLAAAQGERASALFEELLELSVTLIGDFADRLGDGFGSLELRRDMAAKGVEILEALDDGAPTDPRVRSAIARAHLGLARVAGGRQQRNLGDTATAARSFERAHELAEALVAARPHDRDARLLLATATFHLAVLAAESGDDDGAVAGLRRSLELRRALDAESPLSPVERFGIAECHDRLFVLRMNQRDPNGAIAELEASGQVLEEVLAAEPGEPRWRIELALQRGRLGSALGQSGRTDAALGQFERSIDDLRELRAETPDAGQVRYLLASMQAMYGETLRRAARFDDAERVLRASLGDAEQMIALEPEAVNQRAQRVGCLLMLADVARDRARAADADGSDGPTRRQAWERARDAYLVAREARDQLGEAERTSALTARFLGSVEHSLEECHAALSRD